MSRSESWSSSMASTSPTAARLPLRLSERVVVGDGSELQEHRDRRAPLLVVTCQPVQDLHALAVDPLGILDHQHQGAVLRRQRDECLFELERKALPPGLDLAVLARQDAADDPTTDALRRGQ